MYLRLGNVERSDKKQFYDNPRSRGEKGVRGLVENGVERGEHGS